MDYKEQLQELQEKILQKKSLEVKLRELQLQREDLAGRADALKRIMWNEQKDVDRLERISLTSVFYAMLGRKEDRLDQEKAEAYAARVKYDSAARELSLAEEDIGRMEARLREICECERRYEELLRKKDAQIRASGSEAAEQILQLEGQLAQQKNRRKEIREAVAAGTRALASAERVLSSLDSAKSWGTWDLLGGGTISDLAKHSNLDAAQREVQQLQSELRCFKTELADVTIHAEIQVSVDGFLRFADYFFDGLFTDWMVLDKISQSRSSVQNVRSQIERVLSSLRSMEAEADRTIRKLEAEKEAVVVKAIL